MNTPQFRLNQRDISLDGVDPTESLLRWLKRQRLTGTKEGCGDGDCGACTVAQVRRDGSGPARFEAVNACLLPMGMLAGREFLTVEALADGEQLHPVQQAMVDTAGSQCGYCTPGFVMSLFVGYYENDFDDHVIDGNLCRCTGYRPIRAAAAQLSGMPRPRDRFHALLDEFNTDAQEPASVQCGELTIHNPRSVSAALALKAEQPQSAWIGGATDLGVALSRGQKTPACLIALDRIAELHALDISEHAVRIGAAVSLSRMERELAGVFPALDGMLPWFAARQVKNRATLGGNLGSASPIGDLLPWLLAHDAVVECHGPAGSREIAINEYFLGYRKTALAADELIVAVRVPRRAGIQAAYKVARRQTDDISIVAAVYALELDAHGAIVEPRLCYGGVAAVPIRARRCEAYLTGRRPDAETIAAACEVLAEEFTPLDDHRGSAEYRRALCASLFARFAQEHLT